MLLSFSVSYVRNRLVYNRVGRAVLSIIPAFKAFTATVAKQLYEIRGCVKKYLYFFLIRPNVNIASVHINKLIE
jgi:hypothetical protein